jgi:hypothetical protein
VPVLPFHGVLLVLELGTPWLTVLDADGVGTITLTVPAAGAATAGRVLRLQCGFVTTQIDIRLGSARHQIVLPAGL